MERELQNRKRAALAARQMYMSEKTALDELEFREWAGRTHTTLPFDALCPLTAPKLTAVGAEHELDNKAIEKAAQNWLALAEDKGHAILGGLVAVALSRVLIGEVARWHEEKDAERPRNEVAESEDRDADNP